MACALVAAAGGGLPHKGPPPYPFMKRSDRLRVPIVVPGETSHPRMGASAHVSGAPPPPPSGWWGHSGLDLCWGASRGGLGCLPSPSLMAASPRQRRSSSTTRHKPPHSIPTPHPPHPTHTGHLAGTPASPLHHQRPPFSQPPRVRVARPLPFVGVVWFVCTQDPKALGVSSRGRTRRRACVCWTRVDGKGRGQGFSVGAVSRARDKRPRPANLPSPLPATAAAAPRHCNTTNRVAQQP